MTRRSSAATDADRTAARRSGRLARGSRPVCQAAVGASWRLERLTRRLRSVPGSPGAWVPLLITALLLGTWGRALVGGAWSVVPSFQTATYPWAGLPSDLRFEWPQSDQAESSYPWTSFVGRSLRHVDVPFWDPHSFGGGYPFFSNGLSAVLYPPQVLLRTMFDPSQAHDLFVLGHLLAAGLAMSLLLRRVGTGRAAALLGGGAWMLGSFPVAWAQLEMVTPVFALLPLGLYAVDRAVRDSLVWSVIAGWLLAALLVAGNLLYMWLGFLACLVYAAALLAERGYRWMRERTPLRPHLVRFGTMTTVAALGPAVVLVPTYLALGSAGRQPFSYDTLQAALLMPLETLRGVPVPPFPPLTAEKMYQMVWYGVPVAGLAVVGLFFGAGRGAWLGRGLLFVPTAVAVGTPLTWLAYHGVPGFDSLQPYSRLLLLTGFGLVLMAAVGLDVVLRAVVAGVPGRRSRPMPGPVGRQRAAAALAAAAVVATCVPASVYARHITPPVTDSDHHPQFPRTPAIEALMAAKTTTGWPVRVLQVAARRADGTDSLTPLVGGTPLIFGIDSFGGYDSAVPRRINVLLQVLGGQQPETALLQQVTITHPVYSSATVDWGLAHRLGVDLVYLAPGDPADPAGPEPPAALPQGWKPLYDGPDGRVFGVKGSSASPYVVTRHRLADNEVAALLETVSPDRNPRQEVLLESGDPAVRGTAGSRAVETLPALDSGVVSAGRPDNDRVEVVVDTKTAGWLVLPVSYDKGWLAEVDGELVAPVRAEYTRMAVPVPAGRSSVELRYVPPGLLPGLGLSLLAVGVSLTALLGGALRGRSRGRWTARGVASGAESRT